MSTPANERGPCPVCGRYENRPVTVDAVVVRDRKVLLIERARDPFRGRYALPGGFVDVDEDTRTACLRELAEETGLRGAVDHLLGVYDSPTRDERRHTVALAYVVRVEHGAEPRAGDDAARLAWFDLNTLPELAFDHARILADYRGPVGDHGMDENQFWRMIAAARRRSEGDLDGEVEALVERLSLLSENDIQAFDRILHELMARSYDNRLWAAAYIISGGCSDDGFEYFRGWLIAQGKSVFTRALRDPETLADVAEVEVECEDLLYAAQRAFEAKTGHEMPMSEPVHVELKGEVWDDRRLPEMFPRLWAAFGS